MTEPKAALDRARALVDAGNLQQAQSVLNSLLAGNDRSIEAAELMGHIAWKSGQFERAARAYALALTIEPDRQDNKLRFAAALTRMGRGREAEVVIREILALDPDSTSAIIALATALQQQGRVSEARISARVAVSKPPGPVDGWIRLAAIEEQANDYRSAQSCLENAVKIAPDAAGNWDSLARLQYINGDLKASEQSCREALKRAPAMASAHRHLGLVSPCTGQDDPDLVAALEVSNRSDLDYWSRIEIHFALARKLDQIECWDEAFSHARKANDCHHQRYRFDLNQHINENDQLIGRPIEPAAQDRELARPLFVVGMPRSGTTLLDQMLNQHPEIESAGELVWMEQWSSVFRGKNRGPSAQQAREEYLKRLKGKTRYCIDKFPQNYRNLDAIAALFPNAGVIHLRRGANDVLRSNYFSYFRNGNFWANEIDDLVAFHAEYRRLMTHWRECKPLRILEIDYESLVTDPRLEMQRVMDFLGLEFDARCLKPETSDRSVSTASAGQVREPIHQRGIGRAAAYAKYFTGAVGDCP